MCDPLTITAAIGTAVAAAGSIAGGVMQQQQASANAKTARQAAAFDEAAARDRARRLLGQQRAAYAAAGVDPGSGSPLEVRADTAQQQEIDALAIRWGGASRAAAFKAQGQQALIGGTLGAGGAILSGVTSWGADLLKQPTVPVGSHAARLGF